MIGGADPAAPSCVSQSEAEQRARADVVVEGTIVAVTAQDAVLRVEARMKGDVPDQLFVEGAAGGGPVTSVDIAPRLNERWRIMGRLIRCEPSRRRHVTAPVRSRASSPLRPLGRNPREERWARWRQFAVALMRSLLA